MIAKDQNCSAILVFFGALCTFHNFFDLRKVIRKINPLLPLLRGQPLFDHVLQQCFQAVIVTVEVVENAGRVQLLEGYIGHDLCDLLQRSRTPERR